MYVCDLNLHIMNKYSSPRLWISLFWKLKKVLQAITHLNKNVLIQYIVMHHNILI